MDYKLGVTGSRHGITEKQDAYLFNLIIETSPLALIQGCCTGADRRACEIMDCQFPNSLIIGCPSDLLGMTDDFCLAKSVLAKEKPPLERNRNIVKSCDFLVAMPEDEYEKTRSGTWATVRYCRKDHKPGLIIYPSGKIDKINHGAESIIFPLIGSDGVIRSERKTRSHLLFNVIRYQESVDADEKRENFVRAAGDAICEECGYAYRLHPLDPLDKTYDGNPVLHILCNGERVKL